MERKYKMTREQCIFYAKRNIIDTIYKEARLEGIAVTFPQTNEIYDGRSVSGLMVSDVIKINNLKHAWNFIFETCDYPADLRYIRQINTEIGNGIIYQAGNLRESDVSIGGTEWKPEIPDYAEVENKVSEIMSNPDPIDRALDMMLYLMRSQLFYDGNKRTAQLVANQILIQNAMGIVSVNVEQIIEFQQMLVCYYETNDATDIKQFLYDNCLHGFDASESSQPKIDKNIFYQYTK